MNECMIVQDLLPLYAENLVSAETRVFVDDHCAGCETCSGQRQRMCTNLEQETVSVDYKKNVRRSVLGIVGKTLLICILALGSFLYGFWESGLLNKQIYTAPNGDYRFEVVDSDAGFFRGSACITTPEGKDIHLDSDQAYLDFQVWYEPDSKGYFACISYEDHQEAWLCLENQSYPDDHMQQRDFFSVLRASEEGQRYLVEDAVITFDRWSEAGQFRGRFLYFNYEVPGGWFGEIIYDVVEQKVTGITCKFTMPRGYHTVIIGREEDMPSE